MNIPTNEEPEPEPIILTEEEKMEGLLNIVPEAIYLKWLFNALPQLPSRDNYIYTVVRAIVYMKETFLRSNEKETMRTLPITLSQWLSCLNATKNDGINLSEQCRKSTGTGLSLPSNIKLRPGITGITGDKKKEERFRQIYKIVSTYSSTSLSTEEKKNNTKLISDLFKEKYKDMGGGKKTRKRKTRPSTKKHKKRATTKKHKKNKKYKKNPRTRKR